MNIAISSLGTAVPYYQRSQSELATLIASVLNLNRLEKRQLQSLYRATGIATRHSVLSDYIKELGNFEFFPNQPELPFPGTKERMQIYKAEAFKLAWAAVEDCLRNSTINSDEITHIVTVSCTGMYAPGIDIELVKKLNLKGSTQRTAINFMGCYGAFNALKVAHAFCKADPAAKVLVLCVELCSLHFQQNKSLENLVSNAIFADGAAAVLVETNPAAKRHLSLKAFHCDLVPQSAKEMAWQIADQGFDIVLSAYVPELIQSGILNFTQDLLKKENLASIDYYAIHPGGLKILQACEQALAISVDDNRYSYQVLRDYGNMSSATVLFVLKAIWNDLNSTDDAKTIFSCAFGPGLSLESMLLQISS